MIGLCAVTPEQMEARFRHRRWIAKASFYCLSAGLPLLIAVGLVFPETAKTMTDLRWLITTATGLWSTLILGYYVAASYEQGRG